MYTGKVKENVRKKKVNIQVNVLYAASVDKVQSVCIYITTTKLHQWRATISSQLTFIKICKI